MTLNARDFLPLKDLTFRILVELSEGERHGWNLVQALDTSSGGTRLLPAQLYRTLNSMLDDGLIDESREASNRAVPKAKSGAVPSRFFSLTPLGCAVARAETERLEALIARSRSGRLLKARR